MLFAGTYNVTVTDANGCTASATITLTEPPLLVAEAGPNAQIYFGYPDSSCTLLSGSAVGGTMPYSVTWTNDQNQVVSNSDTLTVCDTASTVYYYTVVDANGCTSTDSLIVCVIDVRCVGTTNNGQTGNGQSGQGVNNGNGGGQGLIKVTVCHIPPGNPANAMTKCLSIGAVPNHLAHGDYLGACGTNLFVCDFPTNGGSKQAPSAAANDEVEYSDAIDFHLDAFPNPTSGALTVNLDCHGCTMDAVFNVQLVDMYGKVIDVREMDQRRGENSVDFDLSNYSQGFYMVIVNAGDQRLTKKVMKN